MSSLPPQAFLRCRHAGPQFASATRRCLCPALVGTKLVRPETCLPCAYRDRPAPLRAPARIQRLENLREQLHPGLPAEAVQALLDRTRLTKPEGWWEWPNVQEAHRRLADAHVERIGAFPGGAPSRGVVIVGGGKYFASAYVTIRVLRRVGCRLPIELWHFAEEMDDAMRSLAAEWDVTCVDADALARRRPYRFLDHWWRGWQLKAYALLHTSFHEVLLLDADSYPVRNPEFLFDWPEYRRLGAVFWPDAGQSSSLLSQRVWSVFGVRPWPGAANESGQMLVNRAACWREVRLAAHYNARADFTYRHVYGDKDTFPLAWSRLGRPFARMWPKCIRRQPGLLQLDDRGEVLFQHRVHDKFRLPDTRFEGTPQDAHANRFYPHLAHEQFCFEALEELARRWSR
jgi:hypothetical protein